MLTGKNLNIILILALLGVALSSYLTFNYYSDSGVNFCITGSDCDIVKESKYSNISGIPVSLIGLFGYLAIIATTLLPLTKRKRWNMLFLLSIIGTAFSIYLTYLEIFEIKAICSYCILSLFIITLIFITIFLKKEAISTKSSALSLLIIGLVISAITIFSSYTAQSNAVTTIKSNEYQTSLAKHLGNIGAVMYGSYQCPHCLTQKQIFGEAFKNVRYVECSSRGVKANPSLCFAKGIRRFPTWEIKGKYYIGQYSLDKLSEISGFNKDSVSISK